MIPAETWLLEGSAMLKLADNATGFESQRCALHGEGLTNGGVDELRQDRSQQMLEPGIVCYSQQRLKQLCNDSLKAGCIPLAILLQP